MILRVMGNTIIVVLGKTAHEISGEARNCAKDIRSFLQVIVNIILKLIKNPFADFSGMVAR